MISAEPLVLRNAAVEFVYTPATGRYAIWPLPAGSALAAGRPAVRGAVGGLDGSAVGAAMPELSGAVASATARLGTVPQHLTPPGLRLASAEQTAVAGGPHGPGQMLTLTFEPDAAGLALTLTVVLPDAGAGVLLRVALTHTAHLRERQALPAVQTLTPLAVAPGQGRLNLAARGPATFFKHGWQSWSFTGALLAAGRDVGTRLGAFQRPTSTNPATPVGARPGHFWSENFAVIAAREGEGPAAPGWACVAGFISLADQVTLVEADLAGAGPALRLLSQPEGQPLRPGETMVSEWAYVEFVRLPAADPLAGYAEAVGRQMAARVPATAPVGWCSWYYYFNKLAEADIDGNMAALTAAGTALPVERVQVDDGWEMQVGDWQANERFPSGMATLAQRITAAGFRPGLWLAPFVVHPQSRLRREHSDWLLRDERGRPVSAGFIFNRFCTALDVTHPAVQDWLRDLIRWAAQDWGYDYLKLDFLYAAALPGRRYDPRVTRIQALRRALEIIRETAGERTFILGCGCPVGPAVGVVDAMRIGEDVAPTWRPEFHGVAAPFRDEPGMPAAANALRNTLTRSSLHRRWFWNDPDCLLVRERNSRLTFDEVQSLASVIGLSGGSLLLSDDMTRLEPERQALIAPLLPAFGDRGVPADLLDRTMPELYVLPVLRPWDQWTVVGVFNWGDAPAPRALALADVGLDPARSYHAFDFWRRRYSAIDRGRLDLGVLPPHGGVVLALRERSASAQVVGTTFHITCGGEITGWTVGRGRARLELAPGRIAAGEVWLALPGQPTAALVETAGGGVSGGAALALRPVVPGIWALPLHVPGKAEVQIGWSRSQ